jgi:transcriptional regulator with XRE-family HTH domain
MAELREHAGLTQAEVAERTSMTVTNYQRIEHGQQNVTVEMMVRIANALGVRTADFFGPLAGARRRRPGRPSKRAR